VILAFAGLGVSGASVPASLPAMADVLEVSEDDLLDAVPLLFAGLLAGVLIAPRLARGLPLALVVAAGALVQAASLGTAALAPGVAAFLLASAVIGFGFGVVESSGVALARALAPGAPERSLVALTACVAILAGATPILVAVLAARDATRTALAVLVVPHLLGAIALAVAPRPGPAAVPAGAALAEVRAVLPVAAALFCYVGAESVLAGWSATLPRRLLEIGGASAALGTSAFWMLLTLGRGLGLLALTRGQDPARLALRCLATAALLLGVGAAVASFAPAATLAAAGLAVVACGPCYGLLIGLGVQAAATTAVSRVSATLIAAGALGGAAVAALARLADATVTIVPALAAGAAIAALLRFRRSSG